MTTISMITASVVNPYRFVKQNNSSLVQPDWTSTYDDACVYQAYDSKLNIFGSSDNATYSVGSKINVVLDKLFTIQYGNTVEAGDFLTTDSVGRAIPCTINGQIICAKAIYAGTTDAIMQVVRYEGVYKKPYNRSGPSSSVIPLGCLVGLDGELCGANKFAMGIALRLIDPDADDYQGYDIDTSGIVTAKTGGVFSVGDALVSDAYGRVKKADDFTAAAPVITYNNSKLTTTAGSTPVTAGTATGAVMSAASGFITLGAPNLTGSLLPQSIIGYALEASGDVDLFKIIKLL